MDNSTHTPRRYDTVAPRAPEGIFDLHSVFSEDNPAKDKQGSTLELELDIGFGRGASLFERAAVAPESRIIGIEIKTKLAFKVDERRQRQGLHRMAIFAGDAREILSRARPDACVDRVFVHFPDPWWKKRHFKRRVIGDVFLDEVARLLKPKGALYIQTDVEDRAELYVDAMVKHGGFLLLGNQGYVDENPFGARSNREHRADEDGLPVYRLLAQKK